MSAKKRILIVEDDETLARSLESILKTEGMDVSKAKDGKEGLDMAKSLNPDLILLDLTLPKLDGVEVLKSLRAEPQYAELPVIILTNRDDLQTVGETIKSGVFDYIVKHEWSLEDIVKRVKQRLNF